MARLVCGVGVNDADYSVNQIVNHKTIKCPIFNKWSDMIHRCYSQRQQIKQPTYIGCKVCPEWLVFSNFKAWVEVQDWKGKHLDKDILFVGNKIYSPETCALVDALTNSFITDRAASRGKYMIGVDFYKMRGKFRSQCSNPFTKKREFLGLFESESLAHLAWKKRKHELSCQLAGLQTDIRVSAALMVRYLPNHTQPKTAP